MRRIGLLLVLVLVYYQGFAQTPTVNVDFSGAPDTTVTITNISRNGNACAGSNCIIFNITLNSGSDILNFDIKSPAPPNNAAFYYIDCGPATPLNVPICISGRTSVSISFCKPGNDTPQYTFTASTNVEASADLTLRQGCTGIMSVTGLQAATTSWTSIFPGAAGTYNSYLSQTSGSNTVNVTPQIGSPAYIDYRVTGNQNTICTGVKSDTVRIYTTPALTVAITPSNPVICSGISVQITATPTGGNPSYSYTWSTGATTPSITVNTPGTYTVSVMDNTTGCAPVTQQVIVTAASTPSPPTASNTTICSGTTATLTATAPGGTYQWYDAASGGNLLGTGASYITPALTANTTYYVQTTVGLCTSLRTPVTVSVTPIPVAPTVSGATICSGTTASLTATAPRGTYEWYDAASGGNLLATSAGYTTPVLTAITTYYVQTTVNGCTSARTAVIVSITPIPAAPTASGTTICSGSTTALTATAPGGTYQWYDAASGGNLLATSAGYTTPVLTTTTTYYVQTTVNGCTSPRTPVTVSVTPIPAAPTVSGATICAGSATTLTATAPGGTYEWYNAASAGTLLGTGAGYTTPVLSATTTYYVQTTVNGCTGARTAVTVTVTPVPAAPTVSGATICAGNIATLTATAPGGAYEWYDAASGGNLLATSAAYTTPVLTATTTYYVQTTVNGCTSLRTPVTVSVTPIPAAPTVSGATICGDSATTLTATAPGGTYQWYDAASGGNLLATSAGYTTPVLTTTTTYYVQTTVNGCTSLRTPVTVSVTPIPAAPTVSGATICAGSATTLTATAPGGTYQWYDAASAGTLLGTGAGYTTPVLTTTTTYYVQTTVNGCTSARTAVTVTVTPIPAAPTVSGATICAGNIVTLTATAPGGVYEWYDLSSGGTLLGTGAGYTTPVLTTTTTYYVQTTVNGCNSARTAVTITVNPIVDPEFQYSSGTYCKSGPPTTPAPIIYTSGGGTFSAPAGLVFFSTSTGEIDVVLSVIGTYRITFTNNSPCPRSTFADVTITNAPVATFSYSGPFCQQATNPIPVFPVGSSAGVFSASPFGLDFFNTSTGEINLDTSLPGTYTITNTIAASVGCAEAIATSQVTINPTPASPTAPGATICSGTTTTLTATAPGGTYEWYNAASGGTSLGTGASYVTPALTANTTYYVQTTVGGCISARTAVTVIVSPIPAAPIVSGATICAGSVTTLTAFATGGTYQWYDAASGGTLLGSGAGYTTPVLTTTTTYYVQTTDNGCISVRTAVTVTVNPIPAAPTISGDTICTGSATTLTATAPGGTYGWYDAASGGNLLATSAGYTTPVLTTTTTYYVQTTVNGCTSARTPVTVSITSIPAVPTASGTTICSGSTATLTATLPGGTYQWYDAASGGNLLATGAGYTTPVLTTTTTYYVQTTVNGCTSARTPVTVSITPIPAAPTVSGATICAGSATTLTAIATGGTYQWYDASSGGTLLGSVAGYTTPVLTTTTTYYVQTTANGCSSQRTPVTVSVTPIPAAPSVPGATICSGTKATLTATAPGGAYQWYDAASGGNLLETGDNYTTLVLTTATTYYVQTTVNGCTSLRTPVTVSITPIPAVPTVSGATICSGTTVTLTATAPGGTYQWYDAVSGGTLLATSAGYTTPVLTSTKTYYVQTTVDGCISSRTPVTVAVTPIPATPTVSGVTICAGSATTLTATASGGSYEWYDASFSGNLQATGATYTTPVLTTTTTYYVQTTVNGCTSVRTVVTVTVNPIPAAPIVSGATICVGSATTLTATAPGGAYQWYDAVSGGTVLATGAGYTTPVLTASTTYYVQTTVNGCTSVRTAVTVIVNPVPAVPTSSGTTICAGSTAALTATAPGGTYQWYDAASGGSLLGTGAGYTTPVLTSSTTYYVQTTVNGCTSLRTPVTVNITPIPAAPTASGATICAGSATTLTATAPGGSYQWYDAASAGTLLGSGAGYTTPVLTTTTTYYVQTTVNGCAGARTAVTVTVTPLPASPTVSGATTCSGTISTLTVTAPGGFYQWYDAASGGILLGTGATYTTPVLTTTTTYYVQTTVNGCTGSRTAVTVTVIPLTDPEFKYSSGTYCKSGVAITPPPEIFTIGGGTFSAPAGLVFSSTSTGAIDVIASVIGTYRITFTNNSPCPRSTFADVTITNAPVATFSYSGPFCQQGTNPQPVFPAGSSAGVFSASPYGLVFFSTSTGEIRLVHPLTVVCT